MARIDHYDDPNAPAPNSLVVAVTGAVCNEDGAVLLIRRTDNDLWALPGGAMDLGETIAETVVREVKEETGLNVDVTGVIGIYTNPKHVVEFSNGEVRQQFSICFSARLVGGELTPSEESSEVRWVSRREFDDYPMHPSMRLRVDHALADLDKPYVG